MQPGLVQESPKVYGSKYIHQEDMVFHIERYLTKLHGHYTESRPLLMESQALDLCIYVFQDVLANVYGHIKNTQKYSKVSSISQNGILCFPKGPT